MSELRSAVAGRDVDGDGWPTVSVVMPVRNEGQHLRTAVDSVFEQEYPSQIEICLAIAPSGDDTEVVAKDLATDPRVVVVANPTGTTPAGLNAAIAASNGEVLVRVDGHAVLSAGYIRAAVETMIRTAAVNVGGRQVPRPTTPFEAAVAAATTSIVGTGGARYRVGGEAGPVDTVYLGVFDRAAGEAVGWFDEELIRNQDYELNIRLREAGGVVWFDPELWVGYRPRGSWRALARQYYEYGFWKAEVARRHPSSLKLRQLLPLAVVGTNAACVAIAPRHRRAFMVPVAYAGAVVAACAQLTRFRPGPTARTAAAVVTMHTAWASGFGARVARRFR